MHPETTDILLGALLNVKELTAGKQRKKGFFPSRYELVRQKKLDGWVSLERNEVSELRPNGTGKAVDSQTAAAQGKERTNQRIEIGGSPKKGQG